MCNATCNATKLHLQLNFVILSANINLPTAVISRTKPNFSTTSRSWVTNFATIANAKNSFSRFTWKRKLLELKFVISTNINLPTAVILSPKSSLYDLQKLSCEFSDLIAIAENGFSRFMWKRKVVELSNIISAQINLHFAVILSPTTSPYDLQKLSYEFCDDRECRKQFFAIYVKTEAPRA